MWMVKHGGPAVQEGAAQAQALFLDAGGEQYRTCCGTLHSFIVMMLAPEPDRQFKLVKDHIVALRKDFF